MTERETAKLVAVLIAAYPAAKLGPDTARVYERMLADLDYPSANAAVERLIATAKWPPSVAEIRDAALALTAGESRHGGEAWGLVLQAIGRYGRNRTPGADFVLAGGDQVALEAVRGMGWRQLCDSENQHSDRARFTELYEQLSARHRRAQLSSNLPAAQRLRDHHSRQLHQAQDTGTPCTVPQQVLRLVNQVAGAYTGTGTGTQGDD